MSCFPEFLYSIYVDGELAADETREVESHLIQCQRCRGLVMALRDEADLLRDVIQEREREPVHTHPAHAPARGLAVGLGPSLVVTALVVTVGGWLLETRLPVSMRVFNPLEWIGAYEMFFDTIFVLRSRAPALFELAIAVGAMVSVAAILTFLASSLARRVTGTTAVLALALGTAALAPSPGSAIELRTDEEQVEIEAGETVNETLIVSAETVDMDGVIDGNLVTLAERLAIRGHVKGNVFAAGHQVEITGTIDGSLHVGGERVRLEGRVAGDALGGAELLTVHERAVIGRDAYLFGEGVRMDGHAGRDLVGGADWIEVRGKIGRNAATYSKRLGVLDSATIAGDLEIHMPDDEEADIAAGASIGGETTREKLDDTMHHRRNRWMQGHFYLRNFVILVSAFLVGIFLHLAAPRLFSIRLETSSDFFRTLGMGFLAVIAAPVALFVCFATVVGIPIGVIGTFAFLTALFVSMILVSSLIGTSIKTPDPESTHSFGISLLIGLLTVIIATNLPFVGHLLRILVALTGVGMLVAVGREIWIERARS